MSRAHDHISGGELSRADKEVLKELAEDVEPTKEQRRHIGKKRKEQRPLKATIGDMIKAKEGRDGKKT